jgi:hypothetical protein
MLLVFDPPIIAPLSNVEKTSLASSEQTSSTNSTSESEQTGSTNSTSESVQEISTNIIAASFSSGSRF